MNKKKVPVKKKKLIPGVVKTKLNVGVLGNPKLNKPKRKTKG